MRLMHSSAFAIWSILCVYTYMSTECCVLICRDALNFTENGQKSNGVFLGKSDGFKIGLKHNIY